jgi:hypothetical protein
MNMRRLPFVLALTVSGWAVACSDTPAADNPPQPTGTATASAAPTMTETAAPTATAAMTAAPTATAEVAPPPPAPKAGKEKIVGKWQFSFEGEPKAKAEEEGKKKFPKDKDAKKLEAFIKGIETEAAGEWIEFSADTYTSHTTEKGKDKVVLEVKYEIVKDDNTTLVTKAGKDKPKVGKIDPKVEISTTFKDDNTIEMTDPVKKIKLIFKRK